MCGFVQPMGGTEPGSVVVGELSGEACPVGERLGSNGSGVVMERQSCFAPQPARPDLGTELPVLEDI